jgi:hypothetical protein
MMASQKFTNWGVTAISAICLAIHSCCFFVEVSIVQKFDKAVSGFTEPDAIDFFLKTDKNGVYPGFVTFNERKTQLSALPQVMETGLGAGDRKADPAPTQNFFDHAALFLETVNFIQMKFQSQYSDHHLKNPYRNLDRNRNREATKGWISPLPFQKLR